MTAECVICRQEEADPADVVFADEGDGFTKKKNQIEGYSAVLKFLDKHLKGSKTRSVAQANGPEAKLD